MRRVHPGAESSLWLHATSLTARSRRTGRGRACATAPTTPRREFFDALADALAATGGGAAIERGSIDEAFVELAMPRDPAAFCGRLRAAVEGATGLRVTVGCGPNKLLAKLASSAAKGTDAAVRVVDGGAAVEDLLAASPASRLPGLSQPPAGAKTISDLRACAELDDKLRDKAFGRDDATLKVAPPKTAQVASWTAHTDMAALCRRGEGGAVAFPARRGESWVFEPHDAEGVERTHAAALGRARLCRNQIYGAFDLHAIDATPARRRGDAGSSPLDGASAATSSPRNEPDALVDFHIALCIDLEERLRHDAALYKRRPTRLTLTIKQPGTDPLPIPGNNYTEGGSKSRSVPFPAPRPSPPDEPRRSSSSSAAASHLKA